MSAESPDRLIDIKEVGRILGFKKTKLYAMIQDGTLPPPRKFGASSRWSERRILEVAGLVGDPAIEDLL